MCDLAGNLIDQNQDGTGGTSELDNPVDSFQLLADTTPPAVASLSPVGTISDNLASATVTFTEEMRADSFTGSDILISGPTGSVAQAAVVVTPLGDRQFLVEFPTQAAEGRYEISVGPVISDLAGNLLAAAFQAAVALDHTAPAVSGMAPAALVSEVVDHVTVTFSEPILAASFAAGDLS